MQYFQMIGDESAVRVTGNRQKRGKIERENSFRLNSIRFPFIQPIRPNSIIKILHRHSAEENNSLSFTHNRY